MTENANDFRERARRIRETVDLAALIGQDGVVLHKEGNLLKGLCPFHAETTASFAVYPNTNDYHCHGCQAHGDAITYLSERQGISRMTALEALEGNTAPKLSTPRASTGLEKRRRYLPITPIPDVALAIKPTFEAWLAFARVSQRPTALWWYQSLGGSMLLVDARYEYPHPDKPGEIKKEVRTWCWARDEEDGSEHWAQTRPAKDVPLYGLELVLAREHDLVVICEGAKKAEAIKRWAPHVGISWCGGAQSVNKADWSPLKGRRCVIWPDHDKVGVVAAAEVRACLLAVGAEVIGIIDLAGRQPALPEGFDAADCSDGPQLLGMLERSRPASIETLAALYAAYPGEMASAAQKKAHKLGLLPAGSPPADATADEPQADEPQTDEPQADTDPPAADAASADDELERGDIANASRFVRQHVNHARYCPDYSKDGIWLLWDGMRWKIDICSSIRCLAEATARSIARAHIDQAETYRRLAVQLREEANASTDEAEQLRGRGRAKSVGKRAATEESKAENIQKVSRIEAMLLLARSRPELLVLSNDLDAHDYFVNTPAGTIDIRDGRIYEHDPGHLITKCTGCAYPKDWLKAGNVDATHPVDNKDLMRVLRHVCRHDEAVVAYIQAVWGHSIFGHNNWEQFYLWVGEGGSGKGTLMTAIKRAMGDYAMTAEFQSFVKVQGARVRDDLDRLKYARVVIASESDKNDELSGSVLKQLSGRDDVATRALFGSYREFQARMTIHMQSNHKPRVDDQDGGMWRRVVAIPTGDLVAEADRDAFLKDRLMAVDQGLPAVLAWLIHGAIATHALNSLAMPPAVAAFTAEYRTNQDPTRDFMADDLRFALPAEAEKTFCRVVDLLKAYQHHCDQHHIPKTFRVSDQNLAKRLEARGCTRHKVRCGVMGKPQSCWLGVTLPPDVDHEARQSASGGSFMPSEADHEQARSGRSHVPVFLGNGGSERCPSRARLNTHIETLTELEEHRNIGTSETTNGGPPDLTSDVFAPGSGDES